jgi:hypothetical protein
MGASNGLKKKESPNGGFEITDIYDGSYLYYPNIHNLSENSTIYFYASCGIKEGCTIEVREGSPVGNLLGICNPSYSHGFNRYAIYSCSLKNKAGTNSLCFVFRGKESELLRLDFFRIV